MADLFENLMYCSFSENGQVVGEFYTPRDAIRLMVDVLLSGGDDGLYGQAPARTVYEALARLGYKIAASRARGVSGSNVR